MAENDTDRIAELEHQLTMATARADLYEEAALREFLREAGFEPTSPAGRVLTELAETNPILKTSTRALRAKAEELGLTADTSPAPAATPGREQPAFNLDGIEAEIGEAEKAGDWKKAKDLRTEIALFNMLNSDADGNTPGGRDPMAEAIAAEYEAQRLAEARKRSEPPGPSIEERIAKAVAAGDTRTAHALERERLGNIATDQLLRVAGRG
jgi:hypothetical protein